MPSSAEAPRFATAAGWSYVMDGGRQVLSVAVTFVLAGILGPETFGLAAMAIVYVLLVDMVQRQGMASALIQRRHLTGAHRDTGFWLVLLTSVAMTAVSVLGAGWWADVNDTPALEGVIVRLSPLVLLQGLTTVQQALLRRRMSFRVLATRTLVAVTAGGAVGITGALLGWGVDALVAQQLTTAGVTVVALWRASDWRPTTRFTRGAARDLLGFSSGAFLTSLAVFVNNRADALLIGIFFGPFVVGIYRLGSRLVDMVVAALVGPVQQLALPELAPHQDDPAELAVRLQRLGRVSVASTVPVLACLAVVADPLTATLGGRWGGAAAVIEVLCVVGVVRAIVAVDGPVLQATGRPFLQAAVTAGLAVLSAATFVVAGVALSAASSESQALGMAASRAVLFASPVLVVHLVVIRRFAGVGPLRELRNLGPPLSVGGIVLLVGSGLDALLPGPPLLRLLGVGAGSGVVAIVATLRVVPGCAALLPGRRGRRDQDPASEPDGPPVDPPAFAGV